MADARPRSPRVPWVALGLGALLVGAALLELGLIARQRATVPPRADWNAAAAAIRREHRPGDLVVTAPAWADPLGRLVLGDRMTLDDVTRPDAAEFRRIFELSVRGARHPDTAGARRVWRRVFGRVTATRWERTPVRVATDFHARLEDARVWEEAGGRVTPCALVPDRGFFDCGATWKAVRRIRAEIGYAARRCVAVHPLDGIARVLEWTDVPRGERLVVYTGLAGYDPRYRARRAVWDYQHFRPSRANPRKPRPPRVESVPVRVAVQVDGRPQGTIDHGVEDETWHRHALGMPPGGRTATVRFTVTTRHGWAKHFCFYARAEGGTP